MKFLLTFLFLAVIGSIPGSDIATVNRYKERAEEALKVKDYQKAIEAYNYLVDTLNQADEGLILNLGNSYYEQLREMHQELEKVKNSNQMPDTTLFSSVDRIISGMKQSYERIKDSDDKQIRSKANHQLGNFFTQKKEYKKALEHFKTALKADPYNEKTRYNYELVKKLLKEEEEEKKEEEKEKNKDKNNEEKDEEEKEKQNEKNESQKGENNKEEKNKEGEKKEEQSGEEKKEGEKKENEKEEGEKSDDKKEEGEDGNRNEDEKEGEKGEKGAAEEKGEKDKKNGESGGADEEGKMTDEQKKEQAIKEMKARLQKINMSQEKAKMILEAMRNQEVQYYQQMRKKKNKKKDSSKPDW